MDIMETRAINYEDVSYEKTGLSWDYHVDIDHNDAYSKLIVILFF